jgi:hypothetical protein
MYVVIVLFACVSVTCAEPRQTTAPLRARSPVVARFGGVAITAATVDARILALPATERPEPGADLDAWYGEQIRELAVETRLWEEAAARGLEEDGAFLAARGEAETTLAIQLCLRNVIGDEAIDDETLRGVYEAHRERLAAPERRFVHHIFLRGSAPEVRRRLNALRDRVLGGEGFSRVAAAHSESESRHRSGALGWMAPGQLPAELDAVVFALKPNVPSEPVETRAGLHLLYVDNILPARQPTFGEGRSALRSHVIGERLEAVLAELEATSALPAGSVVLDRRGLDAILDAGDPAAVVLSIGETHLTLAALRQRTRRLPAGGEPALAERAWQLLEHVRRKELLARHCRATEAAPRDELETALAAWQRRTLVTLQRRHRLLELARRNEARLRAFYEGNVGRFSEPPRWRLRRLQIPLGGDALGVMSRLEAAAAVGTTGLEALRAGLGGTIDDLGFVSMAALERVAPVLPPLVAPLGDGVLSPPYRTATTIEIAEVVARRDPEPRPFVEIREQVAEAYVAQHRSALYRELTREILQSAALEILPDGLASLHEGAMRGPAVSVEQLDALLDEL